MLFYLRILTFLAIFSFINCVDIKFGEIIQNGNGYTKHRINFPFTVGGKHYFFGLTDQARGLFWYIHELWEDRKTTLETSYGIWENNLTQVLPFSINDKQYIYGIDDENKWFIQEILRGGLMGTEMDKGVWESKSAVIIPFGIGNKHYLYSQSHNKDWLIVELLPNGKLGKKTDNGSWNVLYKLGFPFSVNGRVYFYCVSDVKNWFIQELVPGGKMGKETDNGFWKTNHTLYVPFNIDGKYYFYGLTSNKDGVNYWFINELLGGGKMGTEKTKLTNCADGYNCGLSFEYNINGRHFFYDLRDTYWTIREIIQEPRFPLISTTREKYCYYDKILNAIEEYIADIKNDYNNYETTFFSDPSNPLKSVSTFRVLTNANDDSYINLTAAMTAEIHIRHLSDMYKRFHMNFTEVHEYLPQMDMENDDKVGQLLGSLLSGPIEFFNLAPQSRLLDRMVNIVGRETPQPGWQEVEKMLVHYLSEMERDSYIRWALAPLYSKLPNSRRPTAFLLSIQFYDAYSNLVDWNKEGAVRTFNFPNVPEASCANRKANFPL